MNEMLKTLHGQFLPNKVVIFRALDQESPDIDFTVEFAKNYKSIDGKATAYVCIDYKCLLPTTDKSKMLELLNVK